jgi:uncharacterized membrane protein YGL010W
MLGGLVTVLAGHLIQTARLRAIAFALYAATAASLLFAAVFALVALRHWIAITYATQYPDLWIALGFVILAVVLGAVGYYFHVRKPKTNPAADLAILAAPSLLGVAARGARRISPRALGIGVVLIGALALGRSLLSRPADDA